MDSTESGNSGNSGPETRAPDPGLEAAIVAGRTGELDPAYVLALFAHWPLFVPSAADFFADPAAFRPVMFETPASPMMAIYTSVDRMAPVRELAPYWTQMSGLAILRGAREGTGFIVNPGPDMSLSMEVAADAVAGLAAGLADAAPLASLPAGRQLEPVESRIIDLTLRASTDELVLDALAASDMLVPTSTIPEDDLSQLTPVTFERKGITYLAAFSSSDLLRPPVTDMAQYVLSVPATPFLHSVGGGFGIVLNPGTVFEYLVEPEVIATY